MNSGCSKNVYINSILDKTRKMFQWKINMLNIWLHTAGNDQKRGHSEVDE